MLESSLGPFPAPAAVRPKLSSGRWTGIEFEVNNAWVGQTLEIDISGRRVITAAAAPRIVYSIWNGGGDVPGAFCVDPSPYMALYFDRPGAVTIVTPPAGPPYRRLTDSGIWIPASCRLDVTTSFSRLFFYNIGYAAGYDGLLLSINIEQYNERDGDIG